MTPTELADRLDRIELAEDATISERVLDEAAAMLREAERLLRGTQNAARAWSTSHLIHEDSRGQWAELADQVDAWLKGRTE